MKHKLLFLLIISAFLIPFFTTTPVSAHSGALRRATVKKCPNGKHYGKHAQKGVLHWHEAEKSNTSSGWTAIGPVLSGDPCPKSASKPTPNTAKKARPSTGGSSSTSKPKATTTKPKTTTTKPKTTTTQPKQNTTTKPKTTITQPKTTTQKPTTTNKKTETKNTEDAKKEEKRETIADDSTAKDSAEKPETKTDDDNDNNSHYDYHSDYIKDYEEPKKQTNHTGDFLALAAIGGGAYAIHKKRKK